jgi:tetratricopeptide (TPR) repeat protein
MAKQTQFHFQIPNIPEGQVYSGEEAEIILLQWFIKSRNDLAEVMSRLVLYYSEHGRQENAIPFIAWLVENAGNAERKAEYILKQGQLMEQMQNHTAAAAFYRAGLALEPTNVFNWYFMNNNLGYCLNMAGNYVEGEYYCRAAIMIDPNPANAYKNLGVALEGQERYKEAAESYIQAVKANARDPRGYQILVKLYERVPQLIELIPDIENQIAQCAEAVKTGQYITRGLEDYLNDRAAKE